MPQKKMGCKLEGALLVFASDLAYCRSVSLYIYHPSWIIKVPLKNHNDSNGSAQEV
jgi:hypothetical protein